MSLSVSPTASTIASDSSTSAANTGTESTGTGTTPTSTTSTSASTSFGVLQYPIDLRDTVQDFFQITAIKYTPPNKDALSVGGGGSGTGTFAGGLQSAYGKITQNELRGLRTSNEIGTVILPIPAQVQDVNGSNWGDSFLNPLTAAAVGGFADAVGALTNPLQGATGIPDQLKNLGDAFASEEFQSYIANIAKLKVVQKTTGLSVDENELLARVTGSISNPNAELLYKGPRLRQFSFSYSLTPRSRKEGEQIRRIVRFFKQNMAAQKSTFLLSTPNVFFLEYRRKGRDSNEPFKSLNKFKPCALTQFNVDNSARGNYWNSYYDDGNNDVSQPITTGIQMSFTEVVPIFRDNYNEFSSLDDVGY